MKKLTFLLSFVVFFVFLNVLSYADYSEPDASIVISQNTLNKFLDVIGEVKKTDKFNISGVRGEYTWIVRNPRIILSKDKARFQADVTVSLKMPPLSYSTPAYGEVSVKYDHGNNKINIKVEKVAFEVAFNILGRKIVVGEVDLSKIYQIAFTFPGPKPFESFTEVNMPDGSKKKIKIDTIPVLMLDEGKIVVGTQLNYTYLGD
ncbi:hypothetical protein [Dictyoglomus thermophilum]|uniref:Uncharacterized protein n=1 Tax=Dictyoglomus thermophilum (strain ATCC 35947 / DSM 3960 / H-6-12) TaxID=309799 RepID=B5YBB7_DICT6|nr:hypothetical protein [Dictyoglomus thermophilum]ACI18290.1 hypothetical protein DICTH_0098 [Dictyoglomus thermophilum H-6-12]